MLQDPLIEYRRLTIQSKTKLEWENAAISAANAIKSGKKRYQKIEKATGVPWWVVGGIHHMEGDCNFGTHLANGDSLDHRTVNEPSGLPSDGEPPFTWEEAAVAAIEHEGWQSTLINWRNLMVALQKCEEYNGLGYKNEHPTVLTPYLWSGTNNYYRGKYVEDNLWDEYAVSEQVGLVPVWNALGIKLVS
jgi:lysozyme family protein